MSRKGKPLIIGLFTILILMVSVLLASGIALIVLPHPPETTIEPTFGESRFTIASWSFPDSYGQGIYEMLIDTNASGSWVTRYYLWSTNTTGPLGWNASEGMRICVSTLVNKSLTGVTTIDQAKLIVRHSVTVLDWTGALVYFKQNFTYTGYNTYFSGRYNMAYVQVLNFLPALGELYTVTVTYQIYW